VSAIILDNKATADKVAKDALGEKGKSNKGFRELVGLHSTDETTKLRGGDLRYFASTSTDIPKPVVDAAFGLQKTGDVAGPVAAGDKYFIIKQTGRRRALSKSFEDVKRQIQNRIYRDKRTSSQKEFIENLKKNAKIDIKESSLNKVRIDTSTSGGGHGHGHGGGGHGHGSMAPGGQGKAHGGHSH
ncbi:MAG: peptidylprolyl isomerase, partial [Myxococcota bacterium]